MSSRTKKTLYLLVGVIISALLIWLLFRNIDFTLLMAALREANYFWLIPNIILIVLTMYMRAYRWQFMLEPIKRVAFKNLIAATCVGFMANNVLPARLGEFVRAYSLAGQDKDISKSASLATIFVERMVFDLVALLIIFGSILTFAESLREHLNDYLIFGAKTAIVIAIIGISCMMVLALKPNQVGLYLTRYLFFLPERVKEAIKAIIVRFSHGLLFMKEPKMVFNVGLQTLLIWIIMGLSNYFVFEAFGLNVPLDASFVLLVVVSILILAPSTPGFLGVYHYGVVLSLGVYGVTDEVARACALVLHATQYLVVTIMGFYFLKKEHLSLKAIEEAVEKIPEEAV